MTSTCKVGERVRLPTAGYKIQLYLYTTQDKQFNIICLEPLTLAHVPAARVSSATASTKTVRRCRGELEDIRATMSKDSQAQLRTEVRGLPSEERRKPLTSAGITLDIPPEKGLAMKADLAIPWNKLRTICRYNTMSMYYNKQNDKCTNNRWRSEWNISTASERKLPKRVNAVVTTNLKGESVPLTFSLKSSGEEIRAAPLVFIPELKDKVFQLLDSNFK